MCGGDHHTYPTSISPLGQESSRSGSPSPPTHLLSNITPHRHLGFSSVEHSPSPYPPFIARALSVLFCLQHSRHIGNFRYASHIDSHPGPSALFIVPVLSIPLCFFDESLPRSIFQPKSSVSCKFSVPLDSNNITKRRQFHLLPLPTCRLRPLITQVWTQRRAVCA